MSGQLYDDADFPYDSGMFDVEYDGLGHPILATDPGVVINPPFNDPWKHRHSKRYKWKHGLLGKSYLER